MKNDEYEISKAATLQQLFEKWKEHQNREVIDPEKSTLAVKEGKEYPYKTLF